MNLRALLFAASASCALSLPALADVRKGQEAKDFQARTVAGETLRLSSLRGKVVLLDFWASWCEPCKKELPLLARMAPRLKAKGIEIVAVNIDEEAKNATAFLKDRGLQLTVVLDAKQEIVKRWEPAKMPSSYAIDRAGVVQAVNEGFVEGDEGKIEKLLASLAGN